MEHLSKIAYVLYDATIYKSLRIASRIKYLKIDVSLINSIIKRDNISLAEAIKKLFFR